MAQFKDRLRMLRESMNLNKKELSKKVGVAPSTISMYESGERNPSIENLEILADFFNVDIDYLLGKTDYTTKIIHSSEVIDDEITVLARNMITLTDDQKELIKSMIDQMKKQNKD